MRRCLHPARCRVAGRAASTESAGRRASVMTAERIGFAVNEDESLILGAKLREAREYVGLKQEQVAQHMELPRTAVSEIENGRRGVSAIELKRLARLYQRPVTWFTGEEAEAVVPPDV